MPQLLRLWEARLDVDDVMYKGEYLDTGPDGVGKPRRLTGRPGPHGHRVGTFNCSMALVERCKIGWSFPARWSELMGAQVGAAAMALS